MKDGIRDDPRNYLNSVDLNKIQDNIGDYRASITNLLEGKEPDKLSIFKAPPSYFKKDSNSKLNFRQEMANYANVNSKKSIRQKQKDIAGIRKRYASIKQTQKLKPQPQQKQRQTQQKQPQTQQKQPQQKPQTQRQRQRQQPEQYITDMKERTAIKINTDRLLTYLTKIPNDGAGDCFFHSFVQANIPQSMFGKFRMKNITVGSLRNLVSELITMQDFRDYNRQQWEIYVAERGPHFPTTESKRATYYLKNMYRDVELSQREHIIQLILSENENPKPDTQLINDLVNDLLQFQDGYFEKFKAYIKTNLYWADSLAINKLRDALNIQFIIFDSKYKQITNLIKFEGPPRRFAGYVMIWWTSPVHYELLQYESKGFFTFQTLPPLIKQLVNANVINCPNCNDDANFLQQS